MAKTNRVDLKTKTLEELKKMLPEIEKELMKIYSQRSTGATLENPGRIRALRRNKARILTLCNIKKEEIKKKQ